MDLTVPDQLSHTLQNLNTIAYKYTLERILMVQKQRKIINLTNDQNH